VRDRTENRKSEAARFAQLRVKRPLHVHAKTVAALRGQSLAKAMDELLKPVLDKEQERLTRLQADSKRISRTKPL
jgi:hypothetical protein